MRYARKVAVIPMDGGAAQVILLLNLYQLSIMNKTILIIERNIESVQVYQRLLGQHGFRVELITTDIQLLKYDFVKPDLFVVNSQFLNMDAMEICHHLKRSETMKEVPVVIVSGAPGMDMAAKRCGAAAVVEKPVVSGKLLDTIKQVLE